MSAAYKATYRMTVDFRSVVDSDALHAYENALSTMRDVFVVDASLAPVDDTEVRS